MIEIPLVKTIQSQDHISGTFVLRSASVDFCLQIFCTIYEVFLDLYRRSDMCWFFSGTCEVAIFMAIG